MARAKKLLEEEDVEPKELKVKKPKKEKLPMDVRSVFERHLRAIDKDMELPWMQTKVFRLVQTESQLRAWAERVLSDRSYYKPHPSGEAMPVIAVDTETLGLDTRVVKGVAKVTLVGICLSADGIEGLYIPIAHEEGPNLDIETATAVLQDLFDQSHLVFYNAKFDREVMRMTMGMTFRDYPYYEDVQVLQYLVDPKADLGDKKKFMGDSGFGLKALSLKELGIAQIHLDSIIKIKAQVYNEETQKNVTKTVHVPFSWIPLNLALKYAAADALCTWLLWEKLHPEARTIKFPHKVDHLLIDSLAWIERQRYHTDTEVLAQRIEWHQDKLEFLRKELVRLSGQAEDFNPGSSKQLAKVLFSHYGFKPIKVSAKTGEPSTDADTLEALIDENPEHEFLRLLMKYREYAALHPENLQYDKEDGTSRVFFRQCVVAGGRLSATGGDGFETDGGFGLNIQAIVSAGGNWWVPGRKLLDHSVNLDQVKEYEQTDLPKECFNKDQDLAPNVFKNHLLNSFGEWFCLIPSCTDCDCESKTQKADANESLNLRQLFIAEPGWTFFTVDYANIEMRVAANISREQKFVDEFLHGSGDFHTLTAKTVFPEFSDPATAPGRKKQLRSLAKTINFALLYGGTEYTIFQNMKKEVSTITFDQSKAMVDKYWEGVPQFHEWVQRQQQRARTDFICKTPSGRIIKFLSAMEAQRISKPLPEHYDATKRYWDLKNKAEELKDRDPNASKKCESMAMAMWTNKETGVRNYSDYRKFLGKIQRVAINVPLQGLAGDFMRIALSRLRQWIESDPELSKVVQIHGSVHDEVDFTVKNEYVPYVLPRLIRLMKLRYIHEKMNWPVPIECDCEYGRSWDVQHHLTGDDTHAPAGWTKIEGLENYIPAEFDQNIAAKLTKTLTSPKFEKALTWLAANTHARVQANIQSLRAQLPTLAPEKIQSFVVAILQLHEFWTLDSLPDPETGVENPHGQSLAGYRAQMLGTADPEQEPEPELKAESAPVQEAVVAEQEPEDVPTQIVESGPPPFAAEPERAQTHDYQEVRPDLSEDDFIKLRSDLGLGTSTIKFVYQGSLLTIKKVRNTTIPVRYLMQAHAHERAH